MAQRGVLITDERKLVSAHKTGCSQVFQPVSHVERMYYALSRYLCGVLAEVSRFKELIRSRQNLFARGFKAYRQSSEALR